MAVSTADVSGTVETSPSTVSGRPSGLPGVLREVRREVGRTADRPGRAVCHPAGAPAGRPARATGAIASCVGCELPGRLPQETAAREPGASGRTLLPRGTGSGGIRWWLTHPCALAEPVLVAPWRAPASGEAAASRRPGASPAPAPAPAPVAVAGACGCHVATVASAFARGSRPPCGALGHRCAAAVAGHDGETVRPSPGTSPHPTVQGHARRKPAPATGGIGTTAMTSQHGVERDDGVAHPHRPPIEAPADPHRPPTAASSRPGAPARAH